MVINIISIPIFQVLYTSPCLDKRKKNLRSFLNEWTREYQWSSTQKGRDKVAEQGWTALLSFHKNVYISAANQDPWVFVDKAKIII